MKLQPYDRIAVQSLAKCTSSNVGSLMPESALYAAARVALYLMLRMVEDATVDMTFGASGAAHGVSAGGAAGGTSGGTSGGGIGAASSSTDDDGSTDPTSGP